MKIREIMHPDWGIVFKRMSKAFHQYAPPEIEWVTEGEDYTMLHIVGGSEYEIAKTLDLNKTIILCHCIYTSGITIPQWEELWKNARMSISFHPLDTYTKEKMNFLRVPLGADPKVFVPNSNKDKKVFMTGHVDWSECLDSVYFACERTNNMVYHTGHNFKWNTNYYKFLPELDDQRFARLLGSCQYVTGLRRIEGFEAHCMEGAMCGSVPIIPIAPTYDFYDGIGIFVNTEVPKEDLITALADIFTREYKSLSAEVVEYVRHTFDWGTIVPNMFSEVLRRI